MNRMPVKLFKKQFLGMNEEKERSKLEDAINQFEIQIEKEGMLIPRVTMSVESGYLHCMVHYRSVPTRR
jgi:hypothetical protein